MRRNSKIKNLALLCADWACSNVPAQGAESPSVPTLPEPVLNPDLSTESSLDRGWNVVAWDDPINLMSYVVHVFQKIFGWSTAKATKHMKEVHERGRSLLTTTDREEAEHIVARLHIYGLQATMEKAES